jgi:hypothetical protein
MRLVLTLCIAAVARLEPSIVTLFAELDLAIATASLSLEQLQAHEATGERPIRPGAAVGYAGPDGTVVAELDLA